MTIENKLIEIQTISAKKDKVEKSIGYIQAHPDEVKITVAGYELLLPPAVKADIVARVVSAFEIERELLLKKATELMK